MTFIVFHKFSWLYWLLGWLASWLGHELLGFLALLALLEGVFGFLALLDGGLKHGARLLEGVFGLLVGRRLGAWSPTRSPFGEVGGF